MNVKLDPVLAEVRAAREAYSERFAGDVKEMLADIRKRQHQGGRKTVARPPKRLAVAQSAVDSAGLPIGITAGELLAFAAGLEREPWTTLDRHKPFQYRVTGDGIEVIPESGAVRRLLRAEVAEFCDEFNSLRSFTPSAYPESWNKSYLLALIHRFHARSLMTSG